MFKLIGVVRNFRENITHVQIDVEDGTGLVRVILWRKEKECTAQHQMIHKCNSNWYIHVIGEVEDYYGVHKKNLSMFDQLLLATKSHIIFWR